ncbi:MAG: metallophosphoesterase [Novosphingobium sp.]
MNEALPDSGLRIGFVADSQLQTRSNYNRVGGYRSPLTDAAVQGAIRPPALDWAARAMLRSDLAKLKDKGAKVIFFLGDGANNGCYDEFARGFDDGEVLGPNDASVLSLLDEFRAKSRIPVYFILGNHDILGAGSTSSTDSRKRFCKAERSPNRYITKFEAMKWTEKFNLGNNGLENAGVYTSNWKDHEAAISGYCGTDPKKQDKRLGCYLAATVDLVIGGRSAQFLLLDTNDWVDVKTLLPFWQQKGARGAMSFLDTNGIDSQTTWFNKNASQRVDLRMALSHYDIVGLRSQALIFKFSQKSQRYLELFTDGHRPAKPIQSNAYVVTGHTHTEDYVNKFRPFAMNCGALPGSCEDNDKFKFVELNIGSTTDYTSYATLLQLDPDPAKAADIHFQRVEVRGCEAVWKDIETGIGWKSLGVDTQDRRSYRKLKLKTVMPIWDRLEKYAGNDEHKLNCIGVYAARVEAKAENRP